MRWGGYIPDKEASGAWVLASSDDEEAAGANWRSMSCWRRRPQWRRSYLVAERPSPIGHPDRHHAEFLDFLWQLLEGRWIIIWEYRINSSKGVRVFLWDLVGFIMAARHRGLVWIINAERSTEDLGCCLNFDSDYCSPRSQTGADSSGWRSPNRRRAKLTPGPNFNEERGNI